MTPEQILAAIVEHRLWVIPNPHPKPKRAKKNDPAASGMTWIVTDESRDAERHVGGTLQEAVGKYLESKSGDWDFLD